ncbi:MAG TPA: sigma-70 family RNA polymerase sigma factor [Planctomycetota bacterium]|nr:sigma-70 family RNA polymerase sigma factor [Planctomycetota bacterium]
MVLTSEQVWLEMREKLTGFFRRRVIDEHAVEDLVAETFLRVHEGLDSLREEERIEAWVFRVARNVLADHRRRGTGAELDEPELVASREPQKENFNEEVNSWLLGYLAQELPPDQREAVELADVQGLTHPAIAERLGLSLSATKSRVQRGRARLRELVGACCHVEFDKHQNVVGYRRRGASTCCVETSCGEAQSCDA